MTSPLTVGFIGLGLMGQPMVQALTAAGITVIAWTRNPAKRPDPAIATPRAMAEATDTLILMLADTPAVESVLADLLPALRPGHLVIDMGTTAPQATQAFAARVAERGAQWLDAPVSGGVVGARDATLTIMAGGTPEGFARAEPLFRALGRNVTHVGGSGAGQVAKAANQVIVGITIAAVAEAMAMARRAGVDPLALRETLLGGFAASRVLDLHGKRMATGDLAPGAKATTQRKDLAQALALADDLGLDMPVPRLTRDLYDRLIAQGDGDLDHAALIRLFE
jgi:3-hydroxyisobutyrate dehydrogenase-like beta-hydroxyacid dehydrogenase